MFAMTVDGLQLPRRVQHKVRKDGLMSSESGQTTGTADKDYNIIWFTEQCLSNALRLETYAQDADRDGDAEGRVPGDGVTPGPVRRA